MISIEENKCPDISGEYYNIGHDALGNRQLLSRLLHIVDKDWLTHEYFANPPIYVMQILHLNDGNIEIHAWKYGGELVSPKVYFKSEYDCTLEGIKIPYKVGVNEYEKTVGLIGSASGLLYLTKSIDGSLIIKETGTTFNVELGLPSFGKYTNWNRFLKRV